MTVAHSPAPPANWGSRVLSSVGGTKTLGKIAGSAGISSLFLIGGYLTRDDGPLKDASPNTKRLVNAVFASPMLACLTVPELVEHWKAIRTPEGKAAIPDFVMHGLTTAITMLGIANNDREMITAAAMLATLFAMAGHLEAGVEAKSLDGIAELKAKIPQKAKRLIDPNDLAKFEEVELAALKVGDHVFVGHDQRVPVDGKVATIHKGAERLEFGAIRNAHNGEMNIQHTVSPGSPAYQCAKPMEGTSMVVKVTKEAEASAMAKQIALIAEAESMPSRAAHGIKGGIGNIYVPIMMAACAAQFAIAYYNDRKKHKHGAQTEHEKEEEAHGKKHGNMHSLNKSVKRTAELAIKMAPCAIMASTLVIPFVRNALAPHGVMVHKEAALDKIKNITHVVADLRGTLTNGITEFKGLHFWENGIAEKVDHELLGLLGKAQKASTHHVAEAMRTAASKAGHDLSKVPEAAVKCYVGKGVSGAFDGHHVVMGNETLMEELGHKLPQGLVDAAHGYSGSKAFFCHEANGVKRFGFAGLQDELSKELAEAVDKLAKRGVKCTVATGMDEKSAQHILKPLLDEGKIELKANCTDQDKLNLVKKLKEEGHIVGALGDGSNDAPFMGYTEEHGGVAMAIQGTAETVARNKSSMMISGIHQLPDLMDLSKNLGRALWGNVIVAGTWMAGLVGLHCYGQEMKPQNASIAHEAPTFLLTLAGLVESMHLAKGVSR